MPNGNLMRKKREVDSAIQNFDYETLSMEGLVKEWDTIWSLIKEYRKILGR